MRIKINKYTAFEREPYRSVLNLLIAFKGCKDAQRHVFFRYALEKNPNKIGKSTFDRFEKLYGKKVKSLIRQNKIKKGIVPSSADLSYLLNELVKLQLVDKIESKRPRYVLNPIFWLQAYKKDMINRINDYPSHQVFDSNFFISNLHHKKIRKGRKVKDLRFDDLLLLDKPPLDIVGRDSNNLMVLGLHVSFEKMLDSKTVTEIYDSFVTIHNECQKIQKIRDFVLIKKWENYFYNSLVDMKNNNKKIWNILKEFKNPLKLLDMLIDFYQDHNISERMRLTKYDWYFMNNYLTEKMIKKGYPDDIDLPDLSKSKWNPEWFVKWWSDFYLDTCYGIGVDTSSLDGESVKSYNKTIERMIKNKEIGIFEIKSILDWLWDSRWFVKELTHNLNFTLVYHSIGYDLNPFNYEEYD
jgi:hypothetical protein